jgi:hypothetical protein
VLFYPIFLPLIFRSRIGATRKPPERKTLSKRPAKADTSHRKSMTYGRNGAFRGGSKLGKGKPEGPKREAKGNRRKEKEGENFPFRRL